MNTDRMHWGQVCSNLHMQGQGHGNTSLSLSQSAARLEAAGNFCNQSTGKLEQNKPNIIENSGGYVIWSITFNIIWNRLLYKTLLPTKFEVARLNRPGGYVFTWSKEKIRINVLPISAPAVQRICSTYSGNQYNNRVYFLFGNNYSLTICISLGPKQDFGELICCYKFVKAYECSIIDFFMSYCLHNYNRITENVLLYWCDI